MLLQFCASLVQCSVETKLGITDAAAAVLCIHQYSLKTLELLSGSVISKYSGVF